MSQKIMASLILAILTLSPATRSIGAPPATQPARVTDEEIQAKVLPSIDLQAVPLTDFLDYVHSVIPSFQYVIARYPGLRNANPILPTMKLTNVTLGQVLNIILEMNSIQFHPVNSTSQNGSIVYLFTVSGATPQLEPGEAPTALKVFRLAETVDALAQRMGAPTAAAALLGNGQPAANAGQKEARQAALNSVLSLIKATLTQAGDSETAPVVQVHEETQTLLLRGTENQIAAVQRALEALTPAATLAPIKERYAELEQHNILEQARRTDEIARRNVELDAARSEIDALRKQLLEVEMAKERLKIQLEAAQRAEESSRKHTTKE